MPIKRPKAKAAKVETPVEETPQVDADAEELSAREELELIALDYQAEDKTEKKAKKEKEILRPALLELMSEVVLDEVPLAREVVSIPAAELERHNYDVEKWAAYNWPTYRVISIQPSEEEYTVTLEENEGLVKFEFTAGGFKFGRTTKMVDGGFRSEDFITEVAKRDDIQRELLGQLLKTVESKIVTVYTFDESAASALMDEYPETVAIFQEYLNPGKPQVSLLPIRAVKETE